MQDEQIRKNFVSFRPLAAVSVAFVLGLLLESFLNVPLINILVCALLVFPFLVFLYIQKSRYAIVFIIMMTALVGAGRYWLSGISSGNQSPVGNVELVGTIVREPELKGGMSRLVMRVENGKVEGLILVLGRSDKGFDYGDKIAVRGDLRIPPGAREVGSFSYRKYLERRGIHRMIYVSKADDIAKIGKGRVNLLVKWVLRLKRRIIEVVKQVLPEPEASLLPGILWGERVGLPSYFLRDFARAGTAHILATSGLHVGIFAFLLFSLFKFLKVGGKFSIFAILGLLLFYVLIAGARASVVRAGIMSALMLLAVLLGRERDVFTGLCLAGLIILLINPKAIFEASFQLSFAAVGAIILLMPVLGTFEWQPKILFDGLFLSLAAQVGAAPVIAYYFKQISVVAVLANLFIVPVLGVLIGLGFVMVLLGLVWVVLAKVIGVLNFLGLAYILGATKFFANLPGACVEVKIPPWWLLFSYYIVLLGGCFYWHWRRGKGLS